MKSRKHIKLILLVLFVAICLTNRCDCSDENLEVPSEINIVGTWILKSAEFQEDDIDLDGDGPMQPIKDIKYLLLELFNVYATCSSIDEIPLQFSDVITTPATSNDPNNKYGVYAVCPEGQGITSQIGEYYMDIYRSDAFYLEIDEFNDPANLFDWYGNMYIVIYEELNRGGIRETHGTGSIIPSGSTRYQHFDFVLEEYSD
jgi:hypothetical protein